MPLFGIPYRQHPYKGIWGDISATESYCEEPYLVTPYAAELINTLTNLVYIVYGIYGIVANGTRKRALLRDLPYLGLIGVGVGSAIFHGTLKNWGRFCDDLSMFVAVALVLHRVYTAESSLFTTVTSGIALFAFLVGFSIWHVVADETIGHKILFGLMVVVTAAKTRSIIKSRVDDPQVSHEVMKLTIFGGMIFLVGFIIWSLGNVFCGGLTRAKHAVGMPWSFFLELHGYWHIFTGIGAYIFMALVEYLTSDEAGQPLGGRFAWPVPWIVNGSAGSGREREALLPTANDGAVVPPARPNGLARKITPD